jgi:hypothetical protein
VEEVNEIAFEHEWTPVLSASKTQYTFPDRPTKFLEQTYSQPIVYRWLVFEGQYLKALYYGEAEDLKSRINGYRSGHEKQQTNARLKKYFSELDPSCALRLEVLRIKPFKLFDKLLTQSDFQHKHVRCFFEHAFITVAPANVELLNISRSRDVKKATKALKSLSASELAELMHAFDIRSERVGSDKDATQE